MKYLGYIFLVLLFASPAYAGLCNSPGQAMQYDTLPGFTCGSTTSGQTAIISYSPGTLSTLTSTKGSYQQVQKASTATGFSASATALTTCTTNPTITVYECGVSSTCSSPTTMGTVTLTSTGTLTSGTLSSTAIAAGDWIAFAITAGACLSTNMNAQLNIQDN